MRDEVGGKENGGRRMKGEKERGETPKEERWRGGNAEKIKKGVSKRDEHDRELVRRTRNEEKSSDKETGMR